MTLRSFLLPITAYPRLYRSSQLVDATRSLLSLSSFAQFPITIDQTQTQVVN